MPPDPLQPTLWRTCRTLANQTRISLLVQLSRKQPQCVSELAKQCSLTLPVASQGLRALEARGLLKAERIRRRVEYRIPQAAGSGDLDELLLALSPLLRKNPVPDELIRKLATAFTHPTRIQIYRLLHSGPQSDSAISREVRLSVMARWRHLRKLSSRGFIRHDEQSGNYEIIKHAAQLGRALANLATR